MQTRTLYALILATLLTMTATVVAQSETNSTPTASDEKPYPNFVLKVTPGEAWIKSGETATLSVVAASRSEKILQLTLRAPDGIRAALSAETLDVPVGAEARVALIIGAPENATRSPYHVVVIGTAEDGTVRESKVVIHVRELAQKSSERPMGEKNGERPTERPMERPTERPAEKPAEPRKDASAPRYDIIEHRFAALLERLAHIEKRLEKLEANAGRPEPKPTPDHRPDHREAVRMTLSPEHAVIGADGGKVALLFMGGEKDQRVPLTVRFNESLGWRVGLEQDFVLVPAHQRAWIWVNIHPPAACALVADAETACEPSSAAGLEYAIVQAHSPGPYVTKGTASARMS